MSTEKFNQIELYQHPGKTYDAGVKDYRETCGEPDNTPRATDLLAYFKITPQGWDFKYELPLESPDSQTGAN